MTIAVRTTYVAELSPADLAELIEAARSDDPEQVLAFFQVEANVVLEDQKPETATRLALIAAVDEVNRAFAGIDLSAPAENVVQFKAPLRRKVQTWNFVGPNGEKMAATIPVAAETIGCSYAAVWAIARGRGLTAFGWRCVGKTVA